jgi:methionine--tRNA ligase beta chain
MHIRNLLIRISTTASKSIKMASTQCGGGDHMAQGIIENSKRIEQELSAMEARCAAVGKTIIASEEDRLRKENAQLKDKVGVLLNRLQDLQSARGVTQYPKPVARETATDIAQQPPVNTEIAPPTKDTDQPPQAKKAKSDGKAKSKSNAPSGEEIEPDVSRLDMRVGRIVKADKHPDADALYVEEVDIGEGKNRTVVSGLVKHVPLEQMQNRLAILLCNLKPAKMRGVESQAMVMCASTPEKVEILDPPAGSVPGDRVICMDFPGTPDPQLNPKKKVWETIQPHLQVNADGFATYKNSIWEIENKGRITAPSLRNVSIK